MSRHRWQSRLYSLGMTTYTAGDGSKIDVDPATIKMLEALSLASRKPINVLAATAVELLRVQMIEAKSRGRKPAQ